MADCVQSLNVICKHVNDSDTYYVDFTPLLGTNETLSSIVSVTCSDSALTAGTATVFASQFTDTRTERDADGNTTTTTYVVATAKGCSFTLTGGTTGAGCSTVIVVGMKSTGKTATVECLIDIHGTDV